MNTHSENNQSEVGEANHSTVSLALHMTTVAALTAQIDRLEATVARLRRETEADQRLMRAEIKERHAALVKLDAIADLIGCEYPDELVQEVGRIFGVRVAYGRALAEIRKTLGLPDAAMASEIVAAIKRDRSGEVGELREQLDGVAHEHTAMSEALSEIAEIITGDDALEAWDSDALDDLVKKTRLIAEREGGGDV